MNNQHVGMVDSHNDGEEEKTIWAYGPHLAPALQFLPTCATVEKPLFSEEAEAMRAAPKVRKLARTAADIRE